MVTTYGKTEEASWVEYYVLTRFEPGYYCESFRTICTKHHDMIVSIMYFFMLEAKILFKRYFI